MSIRVAHILGSLGMGGAERVALDLAFVQKKLGMEVCVISLADVEGGALTGEFADAGITVHRIPKRPGLDTGLPRRVARRMKELGIQVAHTHNTQPLVYAAAACRIAGLAVIHTKHGEGHLVSKAGQFLRRLGSPFVHSFVAVSEKTAEHAREQWATPFPNKIRVIPNGIRLDKHKADPVARGEIRRELGIDDDAWIVVTVGRCDENKNQSLLVRAAESLLSNQFHLVFVGDGPTISTLRSSAERSSLKDSVHVLGRRFDVARIMAAADVFALPSISEGLPLVLLEAMATGLPVVSTAVGGIPAVIDDGETGILIPSQDEAAMEAALRALADDREKARILGDAGRRLVEDYYSAARMTAEYVTLYKQALRGM